MISEMRAGRFRQQSLARNDNVAAAARKRERWKDKVSEGPMEPTLLTRSIAGHLDPFAEHTVEVFTPHDLQRTVRAGLAKPGIIAMFTNFWSHPADAPQRLASNAPVRTAEMTR
jgi:hypothetical protein